MSKKTFGEIHNLVSNGDVVAAETEARGWLLARPEDPAVLGNVGGIFIDLGNYTKNTVLVREGVDLTRRARVLKPSDRLSYNLANGLLELLPSTPESYVTVSFNPDMAEVFSLLRGNRRKRASNTRADLQLRVGSPASRESS